MQVALYSPQAGRELEAMGSGPRVDLGSVEVVQPEQAETVLAPELMVQHRLRAHFNDEITLLGFDLDPVDVPAGGTLSLDLHWLVSNPPADNYTLLLELLAPDGALAAHWQRSPVNDSLPTKDWQPGQYLRGLQQLGLPPQIEPGNYELQVKLLDAAGQPIPFNPAPTGSGLRRLLAWAASTVNEGLVLSRLQIAEPPERPHSFDLPGMAFPVNYQLGQQVELLGYDLDLASAEPGGEIALTLYWQARGATGRPYKVFTHLGRDGLAPLAQHDGVPGEGCCPPDTWVEGEVIVDRHLIPLAADLIPGTYHLTAGMYHEASGERLPVSTAQAGEVLGDQIPLTEIDILPRRTPMPVPVLPEMTHRIYLPLVESNQ
jgi:hypothetical protein